MTTHLLDVGAVIALLDPMHIHHERAHRWFAGRDSAPWHTSPTVQNGVVRVISNPRYPNHQSAPIVLASLASLAAREDHSFLADSVSLLDASIHTERLLTASQVTDTYLLHLAASNDARLATFDQRLVTSAVPRGSAVVYPIP